MAMTRNLASGLPSLQTWEEEASVVLTCFVTAAQIHEDDVLTFETLTADLVRVREGSMSTCGGAVWSTLSSCCFW